MTTSTDRTNDRTFPTVAFIDPGGGNLPEAKRLAHRFVDLALELRSRSAARPTSPPELDADDIQSVAEFPTSPVDDGEILRRLRGLLEATANTTSPRFIAHMGAFPTAMSALGDFVSSTVNNNLIGRELAPVFTRLEAAVTSEFARLFGLPSSSGGMLATGGSLSNLHAMTVARNARFGLEEGLQGLERRPVVVASEASHASIEKNATVLGLGRNGVIWVQTDSDSRMCVRDLERKIAGARSAGMIPFCTVATAGTTVTGSLDDLREVGRVTKEAGLWFHVDAAWGGALQLSARHRSRLDGIDLADSITFCPQKLMLVALSNSITMFRDINILDSCFRTPFPYLHSKTQAPDAAEIGLQGSRPAEVLKLWLSMQHLGRSTYEGLLDLWVELATRVAQKVRARSHYELASEPQSAIACFRSAPDGLSEEERDQLNARLHRFVLEQGGLNISRVHYKGHLWLRTVFQNPYVQTDVVDRLFECLDHAESIR